MTFRLPVHEPNQKISKVVPVQILDALQRFDGLLTEEAPSPGNTLVFILDTETSGLYNSCCILQLTAKVRAVKLLLFLRPRSAPPLVSIESGFRAKERD